MASMGDLSGASLPSTATTRCCTNSWFPGAELRDDDAVGIADARRGRSQQTTIISVFGAVFRARLQFVAGEEIGDPVNDARAVLVCACFDEAVLFG